MEPIYLQLNLILRFCCLKWQLKILQWGKQYYQFLIAKKEVLVSERLVNKIGINIQINESIQ